MARQPGIFVTGTDTDVGKTLVSCAILHGLREAGVRAVGMKPIASGCVQTAAGLRNDDALALQEHGVNAPYELINPFAYEPPIAPHLAAHEVGRPISLDAIESSYGQLGEHADFVVVEGAGGYRVPVDEEHTLSEIAQRLNLGVVLVVAIRLGCLNHALLTVEAIRADRLPLLGWVANHVDAGVLRADAQVETLRERIGSPLLGELAHQQAPDPKRLAEHLRLGPLR